MKKIYTIASVIIFILVGCSPQKHNSKFVLNGKNLKTIVYKAIEGTSAANDSLSQLIDLTLPTNTNFNQLEIDSINTTGNQKLYTILLTYPNPIYNRFAIYGKPLKAILIDKSLNGNVYQSKLDVNGNSFVKIIEDYKSKDVFELNRVSLYKINDTSAGLIFRAYTKFIEPKISYTQNIDEITPDRIKTSFVSSPKTSLMRKADIFNYDSVQKRYESTSQLFYNFVKQKIDQYSQRLSNPLLSDRNSALESVGINPNVLSTRNGTTDSTKGFSISLTKDWTELNGIVLTQYLKKEFKGIKFVNSLIGASISVVMIPPQDSAEMYINYELPNKTEGKYIVRYSKKIELRKDFIQFYEYSCGTKKYLIIFQASKYTYDKNKDMFQIAINSFTMDCDV